jgi:asparagine synthase (glutamine-hydrolysing)
LISDVPLGALLSGGTDSSTVVALMARATSKPVKTFSIAFGHDDFNEAPYARLVAQAFGTDHHELVVEPNILETVQTLTRSLEEPFGDPSMLPTYYVSSMARKHVTVALSGDGGDEIFAGYDRYAINLRRDKFGRLAQSLGRWYRHNLYPRLPKTMPGRRLSYAISLPWRERYAESVMFVPSLERDIPLLSDAFREHLKTASTPENEFYRFFDEAPTTNPQDQLLYVDTKTYLVGDILTKVDRMSMANSLEVRVPILDHVFVEWATGLPIEWKLRGRQQKYILRKLAERLGVPHEALHRKKQGFAMPLVHWIRQELKDLILTTLLEPRTLQRGYLNPARVRELLDEHFRGYRNHSGGIWRLMMFELWHRNYLERIRSTDENHTPYRVTRTAETLP